MHTTYVCRSNRCRYGKINETENQRDYDPVLHPLFLGLVYTTELVDPALISVENIIVEFFFYVLLLDANTSLRTTRLGPNRISS